MDADRWVDSLRRAAAEQAALCRLLGALAARQGELIARGDIDVVEEILAERAGLVQRLVGVGREVETYRDAWRAGAGSLPTGVRAGIEASLTQVAGLLDCVAERDRGDRLALEARCAAVSVQLSGLTRGRGAVAAYGAGVGGGAAGARFQDRKG